jgi:hypothetical protein
MTAEVVTRRFRSNDAEPLIALWQKVLPSSQPWNEPRDVLCRKMNRHDDLVFVAERNGEIIGAVIVGYDGIRGWIYSLAVSHEQRRCGIGRKLVDAAESALLGLGCPKVNLQVRLTNLEVLEFYRRCGYEAEDRASLGKRLLEGSDLPADPVPTIRVTDQICLSQISCDDRSAYLKHLNETDQFRNTASLPYPYTEFHADKWLAKVRRQTLAQDHKVNWAIRNADGELIGSIGFMETTEGEKAEIGYWLAKPYWAQGITTAAVRHLCSFGFDRYRLQRIHARVFATNPPSARVLAKAGFEHEGTLRNHFFRDGQSVDVLVFGLLKEQPQ